MATPYSITINIATDTLTRLSTGQFKLYAFKGAQGPPGGAPVVWFSTLKYSSQTQISWTEDYLAYTATSTDLSATTVVSASSTVPIDLGEVADVGDGGLMTVVQGQDSNSVVIQNNTLDDYNCGLAQQATLPGGGSTVTPMCVFPLLSGSADEIVPIERVFLMFATGEANTGSVLEQAYTYGALIDLTANNHMVVPFDLAAVLGGWTKAPGVSPQPPQVDLVPLMISSSLGALTTTKTAELAAD